VRGGLFFAGFLFGAAGRTLSVNEKKKRINKKCSKDNGAPSVFAYDKLDKKKEVPMYPIGKLRKIIAKKIVLRFLKMGFVRHLALVIAEAKVKKFVQADVDYVAPGMAKDNSFYAIRSFLRSLERGVARGIISFQYIEKLLKSFLYSFHPTPGDSFSFNVRYGIPPPNFLLLSPTAACNLNCPGCYANCDQKNKITLDFPTVVRILKEKQESWGSYFTVISGGEPFMYRDGDKTIFDVFEAFPENLFLVYTNGSLIDKKAAERLRDLGNVAPAISVEGFEEETDARRGKGMHKRILKAMENLRSMGVMFGLSITVTSKNADLFISRFDEFCDYYMDELGASFAWMFQYMPIGKNHDTFNLLVPPDKRRALFDVTWDMVKNRDRFLIDFWNSGVASGGCLAAGRIGGFIYIDWNGNVMPCVFNPYYVDNIKEVYARGGHLDDVLFSPLMTGLRKWQRRYYFNREAAEKKNSALTCCPLKDHFAETYELLKKSKVRFSNPEAEAAFYDRKYYRNMVCYGNESRRYFDPLWEKYLAPERLGWSPEKVPEETDESECRPIAVNERP
jgi:MoaA/NifB/PqqE/SkfB family radical SAM enzyme